MHQLKDILQKCALSEIESEIYLAVLSLTSPSVTDIAKRIGKNRTAVYFHIKNLLEKGIIKETRQGRKLRFIALPPSEMAAKMDMIVTNLKSVVPQLEALQKIEMHMPLIEVTESKSGYYKIYDEISSQPTGSIFRVLEGKKAIVSEFKLLSEEELAMFFQRNAQRKIVAKGIFTQESLSVPKKMLSKANFDNLLNRRWHIRTLPEDIVPFQQLFFIYGDKIAFLFPDTNLVVTITHKNIAEALTAFFDGLYAFAKPSEWTNTTLH